MPKEEYYPFLDTPDSDDTVIVTHAGETYRATLDSLGVGGGSGVSDHGALTGLGDDDHSQYHNDSRAGTWHSNVAHSYTALSDKPTIGTAAAKDIPATGDATSGQVVIGSDTRLSDSRTPTTHSHSYTALSDKPTLGTAAAKDVPATGDATTNQVVLGSDTRLTDARTPASHSHSHTALSDIGSNTHAQLDTFKSGIESIQSATHFVTGIADRSLSTISLSGRIFTIAPVSGTFDIYSDGIKYSKGSCQTTIDDVVGLHYIYFDSTGTLQHAQFAWTIVSANVPVATVYWNGSVGAITDERHSANRSQTWHAWAHLTVGTRYESGFAGTFTTANMSVTQGILWDEDLRFDSGSTRTNCRLWYRAAGGAAMTFTANVGVAASINSGNGKLQWDDNGTLTDATNKYVVNWVYATNDNDYPIMCVVGQAEYNTITLARNAPLPSFPNVPTAELKLIYRTIWQGATATFIESTDYRTSATLPAGGTTTPSASNVTVVPTGNIAATNVQAAIEELDAEKSATGHNHTGVYEPVLGNPAGNGYVLSSTTGGTRSWVPQNAAMTSIDIETMIWMGL